MSFSRLQAQTIYAQSQNLARRGVLYIRARAPYVLGLHRANWLHPKSKSWQARALFIQSGETTMAESRIDKAAQLAKLPVRPDEDPTIVAIGGFYRRWFNLHDELQPIVGTVSA